MALTDSQIEKQMQINNQFAFAYDDPQNPIFIITKMSASRRFNIFSYSKPDLNFYFSWMTWQESKGEKEEILRLPFLRHWYQCKE